MPKYISIHIPTPCQQKWEEMDAVKGGNFCNSCQKTVIDFSGYTDNQLMEYFRSNPTGVCGRFYADQLEQPLPVPVKRIPWLKYFLRVALPAMLLNYKAQAQKLIKKYNVPVVMIAKTPVVSTLRTSVTVTGRITGPGGVPVAGASVLIKGTDFGTAADDKGVFTIRLDNEQMFLEISSVGFKTKLLTISKSVPDISMDIPMEQNIDLEAVVITSGPDNRCRRFVAGGVASGLTARTLSSNTDSIKARFDNPISVFPNPAQSGSTVTLQWKKPLSNDQQVILYSASGNKVLQKNISGKNTSLYTAITLGKYAAGLYIFHIVDCKTRERQQVSFIIK